jgi:hypothetical protein
MSYGSKQQQHHEQQKNQILPCRVQHGKCAPLLRICSSEVTFLASIHGVDTTAHFSSFIINSLVAVLELITERL